MKNTKLKRKSVKIILGIVLGMLCLALVLGGVYLIFFMPSSKPVTYTTKHALNLVAHRGSNAYAPENSLAGIGEAKNRGYDATEFDITTNADGTWYVMHDDTVDRTTDGSGDISKLTDSELEKMKIDFGGGLESYTDEKIPTAEEMLDECLKNDIPAIIEIKRSNGRERDYKKLAEIISKRTDERSVIISFEGDALIEMKKYLPNRKMWFLTNNITTEQIDFCTANKIDGIDFNSMNPLYPTMIRRCRKNNLELGAWTVDNKMMAHYLSAVGVEYITTNKLLPRSD